MAKLAEKPKLSGTQLYLPQNREALQNYKNQNSLNRAKHEARANAKPKAEHENSAHHYPARYPIV